MRVFPAVDIKGGRCVRLLQGRADAETVYGEDPVAQARGWAEAGAARLHLVDLDGAFGARPVNREICLSILRGLEIEVEVGGGIRSEEAAERYIDAGAARVIVGTRAAEDPDFLQRLAERFPGRINVGVDAADGLLVTDGWVKRTRMRAEAFGPRDLSDVVYLTSGPGAPDGHGPPAHALQADDLLRFDAVLDAMEQEFGAEFARGFIAEEMDPLLRHMSSDKTYCLPVTQTRPAVVPK